MFRQLSVVPAFEVGTGENQYWQMHAIIEKVGHHPTL